jgi:hypothetical protein
MVHQFPRHPLKGLYLIFELITTLFPRLPSWILGNVPRELRPRPSWLLKKSVLIKALRRFNVEGVIKMHFSGSVEKENRTDSLILLFFGDHSTVAVGPDVRHVWIEPTPQLSNDEISKWAKAVNVMLSTIPAYWTSKRI